MNTPKNRKMKGSVLMTVVSVMALMILFLTSTLVLANAANKRAHRSYSSSQAEYTARAAIEGFTNAMSRNADITAAVQNLGSNGNPNVIHPQVVIADKSLGRIGTYDAAGKFVENNQLTVEKLTDEVWAFGDNDNNGTNEWFKVDRVKVSATVRVGKEVKTVAAYINKLPASAGTSSGGALRGLQTAGGNATTSTGGNYTGALALGLKADGSDLFGITNTSYIDSDFNFINGSFATCANIHFNMDSAKSSKTFLDTSVTPPVITQKSIASGSVFTNNLIMPDNPLQVHVNYPAAPFATGYTQKDVPYLFVDSVLFKRSSALEFISGTKAPFNLYAGTAWLSDQVTISMDADMYLMDPPASTNPSPTDVDLYYYPDPNHPVKTAFTTGNIPKHQAPKADGTPGTEECGYVTRGKNVVGGAGTSNLYGWENSVVNKIDPSSFQSYGGNIYCNGDLELQNIQVNGDVRVMGNAIIHSSVKIQGDLVVKGTLTIDGNSNQIVRGNIYNDASTIGGGGSISGLKAGYSIKPNYVYTNPEVAVTPLMPVQQNHDPWHWEITLPDGTVLDRVWDRTPLYAVNPVLGLGDYIDYKPYIKVNYDGTPCLQIDTTVTPYPVDAVKIDPVIDLQEPDGTVVNYKITLPNGDAIDRGINGNSVYVEKNATNGNYWESQPYYHYTTADISSAITNSGVTKYKTNYAGNMTNVETNEDYTYFNGAGAEVAAGDAYATVTGAQPYAAYGKEAYPDDMKREVIYTGSDESKRIIKTLEEAQFDIGYDPVAGEFGTEYSTALPSNNDGSARTVTSWTADRTASSVPGCAWELVMTEDDAYKIDTNMTDGTVLLKPEGNCWLVLGNGDMTTGIRIGTTEANGNIIVDDSHGTVNILINGRVEMKNGQIITTEFYNRFNDASNPNHNRIYEDDKVGITIYGAADDVAGSKVSHSKLAYANQSVVTATGKAPYMSIDGYLSSGRYGGIEYYDKSGTLIQPSLSPHWIGGCLVDSISDAFNNFTLAFVESGSGGPSGGTFSTGLGLFQYAYLDAN